MEKVEQIEHKGFVTDILGEQMKVTILSSTSCSSCMVKSSCGTSEAEEKIVDVKKPINSEFKIGDAVDVFYKQSLGFRALLLGYVLPFIILMATLITVMAVTGHEGLAGMSGLLVLAPYYSILYLKQRKIKETFQFSIKKHISPVADLKTVY